MERVMKYINRIYRTSILDRQDAFANFGLSGYQLSYILQICHHPGISQDNLAKLIYVNKSTVTRQLNQLEKGDFIIRQTNPQDRRVIELYLTDKSVSLLPEIHRVILDWNDELTSILSQEEKEQFIYMLKRVAAQATLRVEHKDLAGGRCSTEDEVKSEGHEATESRHHQPENPANADSDLITVVEETGDRR